MQSIAQRRYLPLVLLTALLACFGFCAERALALPVRLDHVDIGQNWRGPVYMWTDPTVKPRAVAIAIHGLSLHGGLYDQLARHLAENGIMVLAPDLRGYGRWQQEETQRLTGTKGEIRYEKSYQDVLALITAAKEKYPGLPLYCMGESLGADMALHAASEKPGLIDGLVLSSPAVRRRYFVGPIFNEAWATFANPQREINLSPYIQKFFSEDPRVVTETVNDPLVRTRLTCWDLLRTCQTIRPALKYADRLSPNMPVLIIQGSDDRMLKTNAVAELLAHLKCFDQTVKWFSDRGHLLLETTYLQPDTVLAVDNWLAQHLNKAATAEAPVGSLSN